MSPLTCSYGAKRRLLWWQARKRAGNEECTDARTAAATAAGGRRVRGLPTNTALIIHVPSSAIGYQLLFVCGAITSSGTVDLQTTSAHWLVSPVSVASGVSNEEPAVSRGSKLI
jgi:hypothetical protein